MESETYNKGTYSTTALDEKSKSSGFKVLLGALAGAAVGAAIVGLFGTEEGKETRRRISKGSKDLKKDLGEKFADLKDQAADKIQSVKQSASDLLQEGKAEASSVASTLKSEAQNLISHVSDTDNTNSNLGTAKTSGTGSRVSSSSPNFTQNF